jgi:hypothetical protein
MSDWIVDLETDISTSPALVEMLIEDDTSRQLYTVIARYKWFKQRDVTQDEASQVIDALSMDTYDSRRKWACSHRYAHQIIETLRWSHHKITSTYVFMYMDELTDVLDNVLQHFRDLGWIPVLKTAEDY